MSSSSQWKCWYIQDTEATFSIPHNIFELDLVSEVTAENMIIKQLEDPDDGLNVACINWSDELNTHSKLYPLNTAGSGDCLLNAASLALWGVQDRSSREDDPRRDFALLRISISASMREGADRFLQQWLVSCG